MELKYKGPLKVDNVIVNAVIKGDRADISDEYHLRNQSRRRVKQRLEFSRTGISKLAVRKPRATRVTPKWVKSTKLSKISNKVLDTSISAMASSIVDFDYSTPIKGKKSKHFQYMPNMKIGKEFMLSKVNKYFVTMELPPEAKHIINTSVKPTKVTNKNGKIICKFEQLNAYVMPISVKWTELDVDVVVSKQVRRYPGNRLQVIVTVKNKGNKAVKNLLLTDDYPELSAKRYRGEKNIRKVTPADRSTRVVWTKKCNLAPKQRKVFKYNIVIQGSGTSIPSTVATVNNEMVAIAQHSIFYEIPAPTLSLGTAFALPSGWSFDYINGGDHHLNEHGMWCSGPNYDRYRQRLSWSTGCIYADKNFDDDYRWSVAHQVVRFSKGVSIHRDTPWLAKSGSLTTHNGEFSHDDLKQFDNAIVLIRGWRFDFTSGDHHINNMTLWVDNINFDKTSGRVHWKTKVTYADKNFDDNYRYKYSYTILGFNGKVAYKSYSGSDAGGSAAHMGKITSNALRNYENALVFPLGWKFDFKSRDHHINENNFKVQNVLYNKTTGKVSWSTHLKYSDKNHDDDYYWSYKVAVITTNDGESREVNNGPYIDRGGLDSKYYTKNLNALFTPITWTNGRKDGTETGVDCGGNSPARNMNSCRNSIDPGSGSNSNLFSLTSVSNRNVIRTFATIALFEYAQYLNKDFDTFYSGAEKADRYVEAVARYVDQHMDYVSDGGSFGGAQSAYRTITATGHRSSNDFAGDCEDHAILRAALLRSLGFYKKSIFCADHHNSYDQGQNEECYGGKKDSGGHAFNIVIYKGKYRIMDYGNMQDRYWSGNRAWNQHVVDNIWNDHTGKHWSRKDRSPFGSSNPLVNYPGNPCSPSSNWDWRTYFCDITL